MFFSVHNLVKYFKIIFNLLQYRTAKLLSIVSYSSKFLGPPKGYYKNAKEFFNERKLQNNIILLEKSYHNSNDCCEKEILIIPNCRINYDPWGFITPDDKLLFEESSCFGPDPDRHWIFKMHKFANLVKLSGKTLFLSSRKNYWHLLTDELVLLELLKSNGINLEEFSHLICEDYPFENGQVLHEIFNINNQKKISLQKNKHVECEELYLLSGSYKLSQKGTFMVRKRLLNWHLKQNRNQNIKFIDKIIVSRSCSHTRRWINERQCTAKLIDFGFKAINPTNLTLSDTITIFANAKFIIGPHGV